MEYELHSESSNHFCFRRDECGYLKEQCVRDRLKIMVRKERDMYNYDRFLPGHEQSNTARPNPMLIVDSSWRADIVSWTYNVVDYFDLSREVVALSILLFDRFFATGTIRPSSDSVLLVSIATLHIAIKIRESAIIKLSTLSWFGRGKFSPSRITNTELLVLQSLDWLANPPTTISFIMHLLLLLPDNMSLNSKREIFESSRFLAELSVADSYFIAKHPSVTALAAITNTFEDCNITTMSPYLNYVCDILRVPDHNETHAAQRRLRLLSVVNRG